MAYLINITAAVLYRLLYSWRETPAAGRLPGDALVMGLRRRGEVLVPRGDTKLRQGDLLMLVGRHDSLAGAISRLSAER